MAYITKQEASDRLAISVRMLEGIIKRGQLPAYRIGPKCVRIAEDDLEEYVRARQVAPQARTATVSRPCLYRPGMKVV